MFSLIIKGWVIGMDNFLKFLDMFAEYLIVVIVMVIVMIIAFKLGVMWSKKSDEKKALEEAEKLSLENSEAIKADK